MRKVEMLRAQTISMERNPERCAMRPSQKLSDTGVVDGEYLLQDRELLLPNDRDCIVLNAAKPTFHRQYTTEVKQRRNEIS